MPQRTKSKMGEAMDRFLSEYLPMMYQMKQRKELTDYSQEAYLQRYLKQLEASEESTGRIDQERLVKYFVEQLFKQLAGETAELPYASGEMIKRAGPIAETYGIKLPEEDPSLEEKQAQYSNIGQMLTRAKVSGAEPSEELIEDAIREFGFEAVREEISKFSDAAAKKLDQMARDKEIDIKAAEAGTGRLEAITKAGTAARKPAEDQKKDWLDFVKDVEDHLRQEGVKRDSDWKDIQEIFAGSGKAPDPLSPENRGKAYTYLGNIRAKLIQGKPLTSGDIRFLTTVRSTAQIEGIAEGGEGEPAIEGVGLVDPSVSDEEAKTREATIRAYMDFARSTTGITDEAELRRLAMEFLRIIK